MALFTAFITLIITSIVLAKSASLIVKSVVRLAHKFHVSDFSMGFFVLGLATTTPELFVGINSALQGEPQLSLGNLIGASIYLLSFMIGLNAIINKQVHFIQSFNRRDMLLTSSIIFAPALFMFDGELSRFDGIALIVLYLFFYFIMNRKQTFMEHVKDTLEGNHNHIVKTIAWFLIGIAGLFIAAKFLVDAAEIMALELQLPLVLVGLLVVAVGTNLPELTIMLQSSRNSHSQISVGDLMGSTVANTPVLGLVAVLSPIQLDAPLKVFFSLGMLLLTLITFNAFFSQDKKLSRNEGIALIALYSFYIFSELFLKNRL